MISTRRSSRIITAALLGNRALHVPLVASTRVKIFSRFAVIFLRSPVIPLIPPLIFKESPMRRYLQRIAVDRRYFLAKGRYFRLYPTKKAPVNFFDTDAEKGVPNRKPRFPQKKNENVANGGCRTPKSSPRKVSYKK